MSTELELDIRPERSEILVGEALRVRGRLRNGGAEDVVICDEGSRSPYHYQLRSTVDGELVYEISQQTSLSFRASEIANSVEPPPMQIMAAGDERVIEEVLELYAMEPGSYHLSCHYEYDGIQFVSPSARLTVKPAQPTAYLTAFCRQRAVFCSLLAVEEEGGVAIFQQETADSQPGDAPFWRRLEHLPTAVDALALAFPGDSENRGRWFGWLQGSSFVAALGRGSSLALQCQPIDLGEGALRLLPGGFQDRGDSAAFYVADVSGGRLIRLHCSEEGIKGIVYQAPWKAAPERIAAVAFGRQGCRYYQLIWVEKTAQGTDIYCAPLPVGGPEIETPPTLLHHSVSPLLAWANPAISEEESSAVHLLWGGAEANEALRYQRVIVGGGPPRSEEWILPAPQGQIEAWAIGPSSGPSLPVVALVDSAIYLNDAAKPADWQDLGDDCPRGDFGMASAENGEHWLWWFDDSWGAQYMLLSDADEPEEEDDGGWDDDDDDDEND